MRINKYVLAVSLACAGCVSVESVKSQMASSNPSDVQAGEKEIVAIATTGFSSDGLVSFKSEDQVALVGLVSGKAAAWTIAERLTDDSHTVHTSSGPEMPKYTESVYLAALKGCKVTDDASAKKMLQIIDKAKLSANMSATLDEFKLRAAEQLSRDNLNELYDKSSSAFQAKMVGLMAVRCDNGKDAEKLINSIGYPREHTQAIEIAASKITDTAVLLSLLDKQKIPDSVMTSIKDEDGAVRWFLTMKPSQMAYEYYQHLSKMVCCLVKNDENLLRLTKANERAIQKAAIKSLSTNGFEKYVKNGGKGDLFRERINSIDSKDVLLSILSIAKDNDSVCDLANRMNELGIDLGEVALSTKEYSDVVFWALFNTKDDEFFKKIAKEHKLKLVRYLALDRIDKAAAEKMAQDEIAKITRASGDACVEGFKIGMSLENAFFLALKTFPEMKPEIWRESGTTFRVGVTDNGKFTFATADYNSCNVFRLNFTPAMVQKMVGGKTYDEQYRLLEKKYGFNFGAKLLSAHLQFDNDMLKFLCNEDDDKWSVAHQWVSEQKNTDGIRIRYFKDERMECTGIAQALVLNSAFRDYYSSGSDLTPEQGAQRLAKQCANDFETVLGKQGTLRIEKVK